MTATRRALASVAMLMGFYVLALVLLVAAGGVTVWIASVVGVVGAVKIGIPLLLAVGASGRGLWRAMRAKPEPMPGVILTPQAEPTLWAEVRSIAGRVETAPPDEIRLVPEVNAAVSEDSRYMGLVGGFRRMYIGMPLFQALTVQQVRSIVAHELGHYSDRHTRWSAMAYRGRLAIGATVERIGRLNPVGWAFRGYARLYLLVDNAASRRQEFEADQASARVAGASVAAEALRELEALSAAWNFYMGAYVADGWSAGFAPDDLFGGFGHMVAARREQLAKLRDELPPQRPSRWDTHPSGPERIRAILATASMVTNVDNSPASTLLGSADQVAGQLQKEVVDVGTRTVLPWPQFTAAAITAERQETADSVYRALSRFLGVPAAGLPDLLGLVEQGRLGEFAVRFFDGLPPTEAGRRFADCLEVLIGLAAVRSGAATWQHSWSGPAVLLGADGEPLDVKEAARMAVRGDKLDRARQWMADRGIGVDHGVVVERTMSAQGASVLGGIANLRLDGIDHDVILLDRGMVCVRAPKKSSEGEKRLRALVDGVDPQDLATRFHFIPYEEIVGARIEVRVPLKAEFTVYGQKPVLMKERYSSDLLNGSRSRDLLLTVLERAQARAR